jgi:hypothetical protein
MKRTCYTTLAIGRSLIQPDDYDGRVARAIAAMADTGWAVLSVRRDWFVGAKFAEDILLFSKEEEVVDDPPERITE